MIYTMHEKMDAYLRCFFPLKAVFDCKDYFTEQVVFSFLFFFF